MFMFSARVNEFKFERFTILSFMCGVHIFNFPLRLTNDTKEEKQIQSFKCTLNIPVKQFLFHVKLLNVKELL